MSWDGSSGWGEEGPAICRDDVMTQRKKKYNGFFYFFFIIILQ